MKFAVLNASSYNSSLMVQRIGPTLGSAFLEQARKNPDRVVFSSKTNWTLGQLHYEARYLAHGLIAIGVEPQSRIAIISKSRPEWVICDLAIMGIRAITVPIFPQFTEEDLLHILKVADCRACFIEDLKIFEKIQTIKNQNIDHLNSLKKIILIETPADQPADKIGDPSIVTMKALIQFGREQQKISKYLEFETCLDLLSSQDIFSFSFTSGTVGKPKGVVLTHGNIISSLEDFLREFSFTNHETVFSSLEYSHVFGRLEMYLSLIMGWKKVFNDLEACHPSIVFGQPTLYEKIFRLLNFTNNFSGAEKKNRFFIVSMVTAIKNQYFLKKLSHQLRYAFCLGGSLPREVNSFFESNDIKVFEGYGLTETSGVVTINSKKAKKTQSVGKPLKNVEIRIDDSGEILIRSPSLFKRYLNYFENDWMPINDGWFCTGDMGYLDSSGFLYVLGRKKDLLETPVGEKIIPQKIENLIKLNPYIRHLVVQLNTTNEVIALVVLNPSAVLKYAENEKILFTEYKNLLKHPKITSLVQKIIDEVNQELNSIEKICKFLIIEKSFDISSGELTPLFSVKRSKVVSNYQSELGLLSNVSID